MTSAANSTPHWRDRFPELTQADPLLDVLRLLRLSGEAAPLADLFGALDTALSQKLDLRLPGSPDRSFDERWLVALFHALRVADLSRYTFLLRSRLSAGAAARVHFSLTQAQVWLEARL